MLEEGHEVVPSWLNSGSSNASNSSDEWMRGPGLSSSADMKAPPNAPGHGAVPSPWSTLLNALARSGTLALSALSQAELVAAAHSNEVTELPLSPSHSAMMPSVVKTNSSKSWS